MPVCKDGSSKQEEKSLVKRETSLRTEELIILKHKEEGREVGGNHVWEDLLCPAESRHHPVGNEESLKGFEQKHSHLWPKNIFLVSSQ